MIARALIGLALALWAGVASAQGPASPGVLPGPGVVSAGAALVPLIGAPSPDRLAGETDDTAAMTRAAAAGVPILCGPKTYTVNNFSTGAVASFVLRGVPGCVIQRTSASGSNFFTIGATAVTIDGVTFDSNKAAVTANQWGVLLSGGGQKVSIRNSVFKNNGGTLGSCLAIASTGPAAGGSFDVTGNEVTGCAVNSMLLGSVSKGVVSRNYVHDNTVNGITVNSFGTASPTNYAADIILSDNVLVRNLNGMTVGGFSPPYSFANPAAVRIQVLGNKFQDNTGIDLTLHGDYHTASGNQLDQSAAGTFPTEGIVCNARYSTISGNVVNLDGAGWGIDCGGGVDLSVQHNAITMTTGTALDSGGNQNGIYAYNTITVFGTAHAIQNYPVESDGSGNPFPTIASGTRIENNTIELNGSAQGINVLDNAGGYTSALPIVVKNNNLVGDPGSITPSQCMTWWGSPTSLRISGNTFNGSDTVFIDPNGATDILFDNIWMGGGTITGISSTANIRSIRTTAMNTYSGGGSIQYVYPTAGGSGYTAATTLAATGTGLTGWAGTPQILNGSIIGVRTTAFGSGGSGTFTVAATDSGGGSGATFALGNKPTIAAYSEITYSSVRTHTVALSGTGMNVNFPAPMLLDATSVLRLRAITSGLTWAVVAYTIPSYTIGTLPTPAAGNTGSIVNVTGSVSGKWQARSNGTNWIAPDGTTIN